jgi:hypothetical protein
MLISPRKLRFFVCDDNKVTLPEGCEIEIWHDKHNETDTGGSSVNTWMGHCEQAYRSKDVQFDALSIDVFFTFDFTDPANVISTALDMEPQKLIPPNTKRPAKLIPSGLFHGLAAMARRRALDDHGNTMPLAWEVRTASPEVTRGLSPAQRIELVRAYGLFLALSQNDRGQGGFLGLDDDDGRREPCAVVEDAFSDLAPSGGGGLELDNLLPQWRSKMIESVRAGEVRIHRPKMESLLSYIEGNSVDYPDFSTHNRYALTLTSPDGSPASAISFTSIFCDTRIWNKDKRCNEVQTWLAQILQQEGRRLRDHVADVARFVIAIGERLNFDRSRGYSDLTENEIKRREDEFSRRLPLGRRGFSDDVRCLTIVAYYIAATLKPNRFPYPDSHGDFCIAIGAANHENTLNRPFKPMHRANHIHVKSLDPLEQGLLQQLSSPDIQFPFSPDFLRVIAEILVELELGTEIAETSPCLHAQLCQQGLM